MQGQKSDLSWSAVNLHLVTDIAVAKGGLLRRKRRVQEQVTSPTDFWLQTLSSKHLPGIRYTEKWTLLIALYLVEGTNSQRGRNRPPRTPNPPKIDSTLRTNIPIHSVHPPPPPPASIKNGIIVVGKAHYSIRGVTRTALRSFGLLCRRTLGGERHRYAALRKWDKLS